MVMGLFHLRVDVTGLREVLNDGSCPPSPLLLGFTDIQAEVISLAPALSKLLLSLNSCTNKKTAKL